MPSALETHPPVACRTTLTRLYVEQQPIRFNHTRYRIEATYGDGSRHELWASQKWFSKTGYDDILCFAGSLDGPLHFRVRCSEFRSYLKGSYAVLDEHDVEVGRVAIRRRESLLRTQWVALDERGAERVRASETNLPIAIIRRARTLVGFLPLVGPIAGVVLDFIPVPYHFDLYQQRSRTGSIRRRVSIRDKYDVDITDDCDVEPRLLMALGLCVDSLQGR